MDVYPEPIDFKQALSTRAVKAILPTGLDSKMLATLPRAVRERSLFSAGVQNVDFLTRVGESLDKILTGQSNRSTERSILRQLADSLGEKALAVDARLNLILDTNTRMAEGYGSWIEGQHPSVLDMWPAQELYRAEDRKEPRDWPARWEAAGGEFYPGDSDYSEGRMIALKDDPIWTDISAFGLPYAPFDYNSGMDLKDVDHDEAVELGIIDDDYEPTSQNLGLNTGAEASIGALAGQFGLGLALGRVLAGIAKVGEDGIVRLLSP
jgi:hypothetical protein